MTNRDEKIGNYHKILLQPNKKLGLTDELFHTLVSEEDYAEIKNYNWKVSKYGDKLTAVAFIKGKYEKITDVMWPYLKRIHRWNDDDLDNRRSNVKYFTNQKKKPSKPVTVQKSLEESKEDETKMVAVRPTTYRVLEEVKKRKNKDDLDRTINFLAHEFLHPPEQNQEYVKTEKTEICSCDCHNSLWEKFKAKIGIL